MSPATQEASAPPVWLRLLLPGWGFLLFWMCTGFFSGMVKDTDLYWHLATGRYMVQHRAFPWLDPFSWTMAGQPWHAHETLFGLLAYATVAVGGFHGLALARSLLGAASVLAVYRLLRHTGTEPLTRFLLALVWAILIWGSVLERPQLFTYLFLIGLDHLLLEQRWSRGRLILLAGGFALWAWLHGAVILGVVMLTVWQLTLLGEELLKRGETTNSARRILLPAGVALLASCLTPHGPAVYIYPMQYLGENLHKELIQEWKSPDFHSDWLFAVLIAATMMLLPWARRQLRLPELLLGGGSLYLALESQRNMPLAALFLVMLCARGLRGWWEEHGGMLPVRLTGLWVRTGQTGGNCSGLLPSLALVGVLVAHFGGAWRLPAVEVLFPPVPNTWRMEQELAAIRSLPERGRSLNDYGWGGLLIWRGLGPVFFDGRADLYNGPVLRDGFTMLNAREGWSNLLDQYGIESCILSRGSALDLTLRCDPAWKPGYRGTHLVYYRRTSPRAIPPKQGTTQP